MELRTRKYHRAMRMARAPWGCPLTKNRVCWCYALCKPKDGIGYCGRPAGHATLGRTQMAILKHMADSDVEDSPVEGESAKTTP